MRTNPAGVRLTACQVCIDNAWLLQANGAKAAAPVLLTGELKQQLFVTEKGQKYHTEGCKWLGSSCLGPYSMNFLESRGYQPCAVCLKPEAGYVSRNVTVNEALRITRATAVPVGGASASGPAPGQMPTAGESIARTFIVPLSMARSTADANLTRAVRQENLRAAEKELEALEARIASLRLEAEAKKAEIRRLAALAAEA